MRAARILLPLGVLGAVGIAGYAALRPAPPKPLANQPADTAGAAVRILIVGDNHGVNPVYRRILKEAGDKPYALAVNLADTSEDGTESEFDAVRELESSLKFPVLHVVGSHDIKTDAQRGIFERAFNPRYLSRDVGPAHLVLLDNADRSVGFDAAQLEWLEQDLAKNAKPVTLVFFHRPFGLPFADVTGDDETAASRRTNQQLLNILAAHRITHVYAAHVHAYLPYTLDTNVRSEGTTVKIPATVSGGGGDPAQKALGGSSRNFFHALELTVTETGVTEKVLPAP